MKTKLLSYRGSAQQFCFHSNTAIEITPLERLVPHWFQPRIFRILFVKPRNRPTDSQRLRRNVLREIHDHSAPHRMLFPYENMELSAAEIWDSLLVATQRKGGWAGPNLGNWRL